MDTSLPEISECQQKFHWTLQSNRMTKIFLEIPGKLPNETDNIVVRLLRDT